MTTLHFTTIQELSDSFKNKEFDKLPNEIVIDNNYHYSYKFHGDPLGNTVNLMNFKELCNTGAITWVIYTLSPKDLKKVQKFTTDFTDITPTTPSQCLLFGWKANKLEISPIKCISVPTSRLSNVTKITETVDPNRPVIGSDIKISFPQLNIKDIESKVDTGAGQCCLHAEDIKSTGDSIAFTFEGKKITMNQSDSVEIQTADNGGITRPVIKLNVECEHGVIKDVEFNLNDRSDMPHKVLLGLNFIEGGKFLIDPLQENTEDLELTIDVAWLNEAAVMFFD